MLKISCTHQGDKIIQFWQVLSIKKVEKDLIEIKYWNHKAMDFWTKFYPNSIPLHILKLTLMLWTCKLLSKAISKFQKFKKNLKTEFHLPARFKAFSWFKPIAGIPRSLLQSKSRANTQRNVQNELTVCLIFLESKLKFYASLTCYDHCFALLTPFWS